MSTVKVDMRIPEELAQRAERRRLVRGGTRTSILTDAIARGLDALDADAPNLERAALIDAIAPHLPDEDLTTKDESYLRGALDALVAKAVRSNPQIVHEPPAGVVGGAS